MLDIYLVQIFVNTQIFAYQEGDYLSIYQLSFSSFFKIETFANSRAIIITLE